MVARSRRAAQWAEGSGAHRRSAAPPRPPPRAETTQQQLEEAFRDFTTREDVAVLLINQVFAGMIRHLLDAYTKPVPAILEIPSKDAPYDPSQDSILQRVRFMFGAD